MSIRLPNETLERVRISSERHRRTVSSMSVLLIEAGLDALERGTPGNQIRLPDDVYSALKRFCDERGRQPNYLIEDVVRAIIGISGE